MGCHPLGIALLPFYQAGSEHGNSSHEDSHAEDNGSCLDYPGVGKPQKDTRHPVSQKAECAGACSYILNLKKLTF